MDPVLLGRILFSITIGFHFIFPPLTIGMAWLITYFMYRYQRGEEEYGPLARFWTKLFVISFAVGVATGITMEFQFGTNWSEYSRFVGDIFGAPLAAEGIFTFFMESTFIGVLIFGWERFSRKTLFFSSLMVAIGATFSAFWIIVANSWMQTPAGYHLVNGRAELTDFWAAVFNPSMAPRYLHTVNCALTTGAFFVLGISAWYILKNRHLEFAKRSMRAALVLAAVSSVAQLAIGHWHGMRVARNQPEKLAAFTGLFETTKGAPEILFGIPDVEAERVHYAIEIPKIGSLMAFNDLNATVRGLKDFPKDEWPPVTIPFWAFRFMVGFGMYFIALSMLGLYLLHRQRLWQSSWFMKLAVITVPMPIIANEVGWVLAEVGRQPWIVYHLMKTKDGISVSVPAWQVLVTIILFVLVYALLFALWIHLLKKKITLGPPEADSTEYSESRGQPESPVRPELGGAS